MGVVTTSREGGDVMDTRFKLQSVYGYVCIRSWIAYDGEKFIGMGSKTVYDAKGRVVSFILEPVGVTYTEAR